MSQTQRKTLIALVGAFIVSGTFVAGILLIRGTSSGESSSSMTPVVVAKTDLDAGTLLGTSNTIVTQVAQGSVPAGAFSDQNGVTGQYLKVSVTANTPLAPSLLVGVGSSAILSEPPLPISCGDVALTIPFDETKGVGGYVQVGDYLDVLVDYGDGNIHTGFHNVHVLKLGPRSLQPSPNADGSIPDVTGSSLLVVDMKPDRAGALTYLIERGMSGAVGGPGIVRYVLEPRTTYPSPAPAPAGSTGCPGAVPVPLITAANWTDHVDG